MTIRDQIIQVTGENDSGKTTFALECGAMPEKIFFLDADIKSISIARELEAQGKPLGKYINAIEETGDMKETELHTWFLKTLNKVEPFIYDAMIFDNWPYFEKTFYTYVASHPSQFRESWSPKGDIKGSQMWISSFDYESKIVEMLQSLTHTVIFTCPIKEDRTNGIKTGKMIADCKQPMVQKTHMRIWLRTNPGAAPMGLILKRPSKREVTDNGIKTINILPRKVNPCTWERINWYYDNPMGDRMPTPEETPDAYELSVISNVLSQDQMEVLRIAAQVGLPDIDEYIAPEIDQELINKARLLKKSGKTIPQISKELGITPVEVVKALKE